MKHKETYIEEERRRDKSRKRSFVLSEAVGAIAAIIAGIILTTLALSAAYVLAQRFGFASVSFGMMVFVAVFILLFVILQAVEWLARRWWKPDPPKDWDEANRDQYP